MSPLLCCSVPERALSPDAQSIRPAVFPLGDLHRPKLPRDSTRRGDIQRQSSLPDDLEFQRIFVAASLPEDHPDALRIPGRKPSCNLSIVRSPSLAQKLRRQLSHSTLPLEGSKRSHARYRKPKAKLGRVKQTQQCSEAPLEQSISPSSRGMDKRGNSLRTKRRYRFSVDPSSEDNGGPSLKRILDNEHTVFGGYDRDASLLTLGDVRFKSLTDSLKDGNMQPLQDHRTSKLRPSIQNSVEWLLPLIQRPAQPDWQHDGAVAELSGGPRDSCLDDKLLAHAISMPDLRAESAKDINLATSDETQSTLSLTPRLKPIRISSVPISFSKFLLSLKESPFSKPEETDTASVASGGLSTVLEQASPRRSTNYSPIPIGHLSPGVQPSDAGLSGNLDGNAGHPLDIASAVFVSNDSLHLYDMNISHQLRPQSQSSNTSSFYDPTKPWNMQPAPCTSTDSVAQSSPHPCQRHCQSSSSGFVSSTVPSDWGHVVRDEVSSMYSQRPSTSNDAPRVLTPTLPYDIPHETPTQLPKTASQESIITAPKIEVLEKQPEQRDTESSQFNYPLQRCHNNIKPSIEVDGTSESPSNHSSNEVAIPSKPSKFKEDMASPPRKKLAKKRRSVFRLLFSPHSMRRRSISVPELSSARSSIVGKKFSNDAIHDGAADDRPNPTVRTLTESERYRVQSVGFADTSAAPRETQPQNTNNLTVPSLVLRRSTTAGFERENSAPAELLRRPSLADYERGLSVVGDNRRRPTGFNVQMLRDVQQDDRRLSVQRPLSRAAPLFVPSGKTGENPLMEKALQKHQLEKAALFRSSRRTSTSGTIAPAPIFSTPFASTTPSQSPSRVDQLDPLDPGEGPSNRKARSIISLHSPTTPRPASASPGKRPSAMSTTTIPGNDRPGTGMPLASWSRYPSHTRLERCESANTNDGVAVRDFCVNPSDLHLSEAIEGSTVPSRSATTPRKQKKKYWIPRSASLTFDSVVRYYSNLFTSSAARGRRSSIATGGKLEYPELELLPPVHAQSVVQQSSHSHSTPHLGRFFSREHGREGEEAHELFAMSHKPKAGTVARQMKRSSESTIGPTDGATDDDSEVKSSVRQRAATEESSDESLAPGGTADVQQQAAQQWSRWYQSCVRLPTSLNDNPADGSADALLGSSVHNIENLAASKPSSKRPGSRLSSHPLPTTTGTTITNTGPEGNAYLSPSDAKVRHFPSVTVVDDQKGHWRSISLISTQSAKTTRESTNDLLRLLQRGEVAARERLMKAAKQGFGDEGSGG